MVTFTDTMQDQEFAGPELIVHGLNASVAVEAMKAYQLSQLSCNLQVDEAMDVIAARRQERLQAKVSHALQCIISMSFRLACFASMRRLPAPCSSGVLCKMDLAPA